MEYKNITFNADIDIKGFNETVQKTALRSDRSHVCGENITVKSFLGKNIINSINCVEQKKWL